MATVQSVFQKIKGYGVDDSFTVTWAGFTSANLESAPVEQYSFGRIRSIQAVGTFDSATLSLQGSNDGTNYVTLTDPEGDPVAFTAAGLMRVDMVTRYIKGVLTSAGGSTDLDMIIFVDRGKS